jgi:hypothetical protein
MSQTPTPTATATVGTVMQVCPQQATPYDFPQYLLATGQQLYLQEQTLRVQTI